MIARSQFVAVTAGLVVVGTTLLPSADGQDWVSYRSRYSHQPNGSQRVNQYTRIGPFYTYSDPSYLRSGYRQTRSRIQVNGTFDNFHMIEEWGRPVRPYGEWQFPFRPYSTPYAAWGAPFAGMYQPIPYPYPPYDLPGYGGYPGVPGVPPYGPHPGFGPGHYPVPPVPAPVPAGP